MRNSILVMFLAVLSACDADSDCTNGPSVGLVDVNVSFSEVSPPTTCTQICFDAGLPMGTLTSCDVSSVDGGAGGGPIVSCDWSAGDSHCLSID